MLNRAFVYASALLALGLTACCFGGATTPGVTGPTGPVVGPTGVGPTAPVAGGGTVTIGPGFLPDPQTFTGTAGGAISANTMSAECRGTIASAPNHILNSTGQFANLRIVVSSAVDTTLVVQRADGTFACNDDADGFNPVVMGPFGPGQHRVWVGTYSTSSTGAAYTIGFTEMATVSAASLGGGAGIIPGLGAIPGMGGLIPQDCGQSQNPAMPPNYGPIMVGSSVVVGMHTPWTGADGNGGMVTADSNWAVEMQPFVGQRGTVTALGGVDTAGCPGARVTTDNGQYFWRIRNMSF